MLNYNRLQQLLTGSVKFLQKVQDNQGNLTEISFVNDTSNIEQVLRNRNYELVAIRDGVKTYRLKDSRQRVS